MIAHVDTNVIIDIAAPGQDWFSWSRETLAAHAGAGLICTSVVYSEASVAFSARQAFESFLVALKIAHRPPQDDVLFTAAKRHLAYRRAGGPRERILPDFLIGAHASADGACLLTRDPRFYRSYFPELKVVSP